jgi:predicted Fe-Mo cluster-binding NifX family protein
MIGENQMRIAVTALENKGLDSKVSQHLTRSPYVAFVDLDGQDVKSIEVVANPFGKEHIHGQMPAFIKDNHADVVLSGGMGIGAASFFRDFGIETATGASGTIRQTLEKYHNGELTGTEPHTDLGYYRGRGSFPGRGQGLVQGQGRGRRSGGGQRLGRRHGTGRGRHRGTGLGLSVRD